VTVPVRAVCIVVFPSIGNLMPANAYFGRQNVLIERERSRIARPAELHFEMTTCALTCQ
jgi:hypothetical protein